MLKAFERPTRKRNQSVFGAADLISERSKPAQDRQHKTIDQRSTAANKGSGPTAAAAIDDSRDDEEALQRESPFPRIPHDQLIRIKAQLHRFILNQRQVAGTLQPHINFDTDNLSHENVYRIMSIARNPQTQELKDLRKK